MPFAYLKTFLMAITLSVGQAHATTADCGNPDLLGLQHFPESTRSFLWSPGTFMLDRFFTDPNYLDNPEILLPILSVGTWRKLNSPDLNPVFRSNGHIPDLIQIERIVGSDVTFDFSVNGVAVSSRYFKKGLTQIHRAGTHEMNTPEITQFLFLSNNLLIARYSRTNSEETAVFVRDAE